MNHFNTSTSHRRTAGASRRRTIVRRSLAILIAVVCVAHPGRTDARTVLKNIAYIQGMEETTLQGLGLVVGLKGTGDGADALPTIRALAQTLRLMGNPLPITIDRGGAKSTSFKELKTAKNVALVMVSVTIPAGGGHRGDKLDCHVSAISAKSLAGGRLFVTPLLGPDPSDRRVYGIAQGQVALDDPTGVPTSGKVQGGCMLETDFDREFIRNNSITIVLDTNKAGFQVASDVAEAVNSQVLGLVSSTEGKFARAIDQSRVVVPIPNAYLAAPSEGREADPILFISEVMSVSLAEPQIEARVVINERAGTMAISGDVEIGAVTITYKSITVEAGEDQFVLLDQEDRALTTQEKERAGQKTKLSALLDTLNKIRASDSDRIGIVKAIHRTGKLHAKLIIQ